MKIKRIEHIAIALKNMDTVKDVLANKLGIAMEYEEHLAGARHNARHVPGRRNLPRAAAIG